ncbi:MAG: hypothetical protein ACE37F_13570 [Nannocystaceae bacterium]|nr:hypothetical protein [bacterium]
MDGPRLANLLFLSGLVSLGACDEDEGMSPTSSATASAGGVTGGDPMASTSGDTSAGGAGGSTSATPTGASTGDPSSGGPSGNFPVCTEFATQSQECGDGGYDAALEYCNELLASLNQAYSADCALAYEELLACASGVDCAEFNGDEVPPACETPSQNVRDACDFLGGGSSSGAGTGGDTDASTGG